MADEQVLDSDYADSTGDVEESGSDRGPVPYDRFQKVNNGYQAYKNLGDLDDVAESLTQYEQLKAAIASGALTEATPASKPQGPIPTSQEAKAIEKLMQYIPGLADLPKIQEALAALSTQTQAASSAGLSQIRSNASAWLQEQVITDRYVSANPTPDQQEANNDTAQMIEELVANRIYNDPKAEARFSSGDMSVVKEAYRAVSKILDTRMIKQPKHGLPSHLGGNGGLPGMHDISKPKYTEAEYAKMPKRQAKKARDDEAFAIYNAVANARNED